MKLEELIDALKEMVEQVDVYSFDRYVYKSILDCLIELKERREKDV